MYMIILHVDGVASPFALRWLDQAKAGSAWADVLGADWADTVRLEDEFGQVVTLTKSMIRVPQFMDVARDLEAQGQLAVMQNRAQQAAQARAGALVAANHPGLVRAQ